MTAPDTLRFDVLIWSPFRVATGQAGSGMDETIDWVVPLPASSLKGVMRDCAVSLRGRQDDELVREVFGWRSQPSPWGWTDCQVKDPMVRPRTRIRIDPTTQTVDPAAGALLVAEEMGASSGHFEVRRTGSVPQERLPLHYALLCAAARTVVGVGAGRRRGNGWVDIVPVAPRLDATMLELVRTAA